VGIIMYQVNDAFMASLVGVIKRWDEYPSIKARFDVLVRSIKTNLKAIDVRLASPENAALSGLSGGFMSAILNTIVNALVTTSANMAKVLNDSLVSLIQAARILCTTDVTVTPQVKAKQAVKVVVTALMASVSLILGDALGNVIAVKMPVLSPVAGLIGNVVSAIISGGLTAMLIFTVDNLGQVFSSVKDQFNTFLVGLTVSSQSIEASYQQAVAKVETLYQELLTDIYQRYAETGRLQALAYDMDLPTADQFVASANLAEHVGVDQQRILKSRSDITDYFNS